MARIRIKLPDFFPFTTLLPVRITDLNYGGHVGNDAILSLLHEARVQFLGQYGYSELELGGTSLIMGDVAIEFKKEIFYGNRLRASVAAGEFTRVGFDLFYKLELGEGEKWLPAVLAKTGMVCFDYTAKKVAAVPEPVLRALS
ncbi:MAG: thioesterase family protein [Bacteroidota bacterium]|nr:thioesterase family protein [Bacteroidota bacterium]MDP4215256.1 thioesterase family protein [Bacteroidota bacterium]MDP4248336.1 thioesterase family protein [Bacteroidota bacterium]MDP4253510.1 thioesterase family protein [Bacteroidota bacterium]MDP4258104.1 thioesterase family protein [Bacteroidota bacterium]